MFDGGHDALYVPILPPSSLSLLGFYPASLRLAPPPPPPNLVHLLPVIITKAKMGLTVNLSEMLEHHLFLDAAI